MTAAQALRHAWIFATLGKDPTNAVQPLEHSKVANGHTGRSDKGRPESAGMFSLGDISMHSLRLTDSSKTTGQHIRRPLHSGGGSAMASGARTTSAGGSSFHSHDTVRITLAV